MNPNRCKEPGEARPAHTQASLTCPVVAVDSHDAYMQVLRVVGSPRERVADGVQQRMDGEQQLWGLERRRERV